MGTPRNFVVRADIPYLNYGNENTGCDTFLRTRREAEVNSAALRDALLDAIDRFGSHYRISKKEAQILLMDTGVKL